MSKQSMLKENTLDLTKKRGIGLSNKILPIIGFDIKEEKFLKRKTNFTEILSGKN